MALTQEDAKVLAQQLQDAHRYAAGFYHRFIPMMNSAARTHGFETSSWGPAKCDMPSIRRANPEGKWVWDLLPMSNTRFSFSRQGSAKADIDIWFTPDPGLDCGGFPDPFNMGKEEPVITIDAYAADDTVPAETAIDTLWNSSGEPEPEETDKLIKYSTGLLAAREQSRNKIRLLLLSKIVHDHPSPNP